MGLVRGGGRGSSTADVLVVDDQPLFQKYMQASLRRMALRVALAASAEEVLERYAQGERWRCALPGRRNALFVLKRIITEKPTTIR